MPLVSCCHGVRLAQEARRACGGGGGQASWRTRDQTVRGRQEPTAADAGARYSYGHTRVGSCSGWLTGGNRRLPCLAVQGDNTSTHSIVQVSMGLPKETWFKLQSPSSSQVTPRLA